MRRAILTMEEFRAMALPRSSFVFDHLDEERLSAGHVERVDEALKCGEGDNFRNVDVAR